MLLSEHSVHDLSDQVASDNNKHGLFYISLTPQRLLGKVARARDSFISAFISPVPRRVGEESNRGSEELVKREQQVERYN